MSHKISKKFFTRCFMVTISFLCVFFTKALVKGQDSGSIWIKTFRPGGAELSNLNIDKKALAFVDSLMKRDDVEVMFLGGSDTLRWKQAGKSKALSSAWDQAKKLERASQLRERYGRGEIGTTDEPIRGVKVVWGPKKPDIFEMNDRIIRLEELTDSLRSVLSATNSEKQQASKAIEDSSNNFKMTSFNDTPSSYFAWEITSGFFFWSAGVPYDLAAPYLGIVLKRQLWAFELQGGLTPWSISYPDGNRSDAFLLGSINVFPESWHEFRLGIFSGWEFFTNSDNWTMKVMGLTAGPTIHWKFLNTYIGYNLGKLSTLVEPPKWIHSGILTLSFKFKLNRW